MAKKQKKSDVLPAIPFHYDFYMVYWEDIQSDSGWRTLKEIQKSKVKTGYLCIYWLASKARQECSCFNE